MSRFFSEKFNALTPYVPGEQPQNRKYIKLNTNESPFPPSPMAQRLARQEAGNLNLYSDPECRKLVSAAVERFGLAENEILFTNGSDEILNFAFMAFCDEAHPAAFANITYGFYPVFAALNGVPFETIPLREDLTINVGDYLGINKTIFIANPNAPTSIALPKSDIARIAEANPNNIIVVDEAYVDFGGESCMDMIRDYANLLVCRTFSKSYSLAGGRLGFGAACADLIRDLNTIKYSTNPYNINSMTMAAGIGALADTAYFEENIAKTIRTRRWTTEQLRTLGFELPDSSTNFVFAKHPKIGGMELYQSLKERGILVRHFETPLLRDYNRITIGSREEMHSLIDNLTELLEEYK